jgi:hypothetical protein
VKCSRIKLYDPYGSLTGHALMNQKSSALPAKAHMPMAALAALVERFFNRVKHCRGIVARCDKRAANELAFIQRASLRMWLRVNESAP